MSTVYAQLSMSLDGFVAGPNDRPGNPLGDGGGRVHEWVYATSSWRRIHGRGGGEESEDSKLVDEQVARSGAVIMGRRMFDHGEEPWGPEPPFGKPVFVVTNREREPLVKGETTFTFVTGGQIVSQYLAAGLLDQIQVHIAPLFLGGGVRLFDGPGLERLKLEPVEVLHSPRATHIRCRASQ